MHAFLYLFKYCKLNLILLWAGNKKVENIIYFFGDKSKILSFNLEENKFYFEKLEIDD